MMKLLFCLGFISLVLLGAVSQNQPMAWDVAILTWFRTPEGQLIGPDWLSVLVRDITAMGSNWVLVYAVSGVSIGLLLQKKKVQCVTLLIIVLGALVLSMGAKYVFMRPRPDVVKPLIAVFTPSFPSGHAAMSMACFLGMAYVFSASMSNRALQRFIFAIAIISSVLVGMSRILLGVHWPSDVIAGWLLAILWVMLVAYAHSHWFKQLEPV